MRLTLALLALALLVPACDDGGADTSTMDGGDATGADAAGDEATEARCREDSACWVDGRGREWFCDLGCETVCDPAPCEIECMDAGVCSLRDTCSASTDCPNNGWTCRDGHCLPIECDEFRPCSSGTCVEHLCLHAPVFCESMDDCQPFDLVCSGEGRCQFDPCETSADCLPGWTCDGAGCVSP